MLRLRCCVLLALVCLLLGTAEAPGQRRVRQILVTYSPFPVSQHGLADLTRAQGEYWNMIQEAAEHREKNRELRLERLKKEAEYIVWARDFQAEQWRKAQERAREVDLRHSQRVDAPEMAIRSGTLLNILLTDLSQASIAPRAPSTPIPNAQEVLSKINFTGSFIGHVRLLKQERLKWPVLLQEEEFKEDRDEIERLLREGKISVQQGEAKLSVIKELMARRDSLRRTFHSFVISPKPNPINTPMQQIYCRRHLDDIDRTITALNNPEDARLLLNQRLTATTVAELVQRMREEGLRFGPATPEGYRAYRILHTAFAEESRTRSGVR